MSWLSKQKRHAIRGLVVIGLLAVLTSPAWASVQYCIDKDPNHILYGHLDQDNVLDIGACACGPTAAVNSFVYLENKYGSVYHDLLVPGDNTVVANMAAVATTLGGPDYMDCVCPGGTYDDMFIYGKYTYLEQKAPGKTEYAAQLKSTWNSPGRPAGRKTPGEEKPEWVADNTIPTWQFLWENLVACEDVEILIVDTDWGHYLTLTSFCWTDTDEEGIPGTEDGIIQKAEGAQIDYIDPCTGTKRQSPIWQTGAGTPLQVTYDVYDEDTGKYVPITTELVMAVKESPVPEPASLIIWSLLGAGGAGLGVWRRRRAGRWIDGDVPRAPWPEENRQAIRQIIAHGGPR